MNGFTALIVANLLGVAPVSHVQAGERLSLNPEIGLSMLYDSNLLLESSDEQSDFITTISPSVHSNYLLRFGELDFGYDGKVFLPASNFNESGLATFSHDGVFRMRTYITNRLTVELENLFQSAANDLARPSGQISNLIDVNSTALKLEFVTPLTRRTEVRSFAHGIRNFVLDFDSDRTSAFTGLEIIREINPRLKAAARSRATWIFFDMDRFDNVVIYGADGRLEYELMPRVRLNVPVGVQYLLLENGVKDLGFTYDVNVDAQLTQREKLILGFKQGFTIDANGQSFERLEGKIGYNKEVTSRFSVATSGKYSTFSSASSSSGSDRIFGAQLGLEYVVAPRIKATGGYHWFLNRGGLSSNDFVSHQLFLGLDYVFNGQN
jgi:hypothetical protein